MKTEEQLKEKFDVKQLSAYLNISVSKIRKLVASKKIPHFKIDSKILFNKESIDIWVKKLEEKESKKSLFY